MVKYCYLLLWTGHIFDLCMYNSPSCGNAIRLFYLTGRYVVLPLKRLSTQALFLKLTKKLSVLFTRTLLFNPLNGSTLPPGEYM